MAADGRHKHPFRVRYAETGVQRGQRPGVRTDDFGGGGVGDLTSNVLQRDGNSGRHLARSSEGPVAELLVRTDA